MMPNYWRQLMPNWRNNIAQIQINPPPQGEDAVRHADGEGAIKHSRLRTRYLDVLASIYLYNEHRGYTALDRILAASRAICPEETDFIAAITQHRAEEEKHYRMFRRWFERQGKMPLAVDAGFGHIDHFIGWIFGVKIDDLDTQNIIAHPKKFAQLCRIIMLTEQRGLTQVEVILRSPIIQSDPILRRIFHIIHHDEPGHFLPYQAWLTRHNAAATNRKERLADWSIHKLLMLVKLPILFMNITHPRLNAWPDEA